MPAFNITDNTLVRVTSDDGEVIVNAKRLVDVEQLGHLCGVDRFWLRDELKETGRCEVFGDDAGKEEYSGTYLVEVV